MLRRRRPSDEAFIRDYTAYLVGFLGRSPVTAEDYSGVVRRTARMIGKPILQVDSEDLMSLVDTNGWKPSTNRAMLVAWRSADKFARMKGYAGRNGIAHLQTPSVPKRKEPPMSNAEAYRALSHADTPILKRVVFLGLYAGLRIGESSRLDEKGWLDDKLVIIGKGGRKRVVPAHPELGKVRDEILGNPPASRTSAGGLFTRFRKRHDLRNIEGGPATPHALRRTFATECYGRGGKDKDVETLLGHETGVTFENYVHIYWERFVATVNPVEYTDGKPVQLSFDLGEGDGG